MGQDGGGCKGLTLGTEAGALEEETGTGGKVDTEADPSAAGLLISVAVKFLLGALLGLRENQPWSFCECALTSL